MILEATHASIYFLNRLVMRREGLTELNPPYYILEETPGFAANLANNKIM